MKDRWNYCLDLKMIEYYTYVWSMKCICHVQLRSDSVVICEIKFTCTCVLLQDFAWFCKIARATNLMFCYIARVVSCMVYRITCVGCRRDGL